MAVKMRPTPTRTKRPYGALLYPGPVLDVLILSVGGTPRAIEGDNETPLFKISQDSPNPAGSRGETRSGGQFYWGGILLKSNAGVQRCTRLGWKSSGLCNGKSALNCESDSSSRCESRS